MFEHVSSVSNNVLFNVLFPTHGTEYQFIKFAFNTELD
jgi:hypothetical protein